MDKLDNILVIFDGKHHTQTALLRAIELSRLTDATLHIVAITYTNLSYVNDELRVKTEALLLEGVLSDLNRELGKYIDSIDAEGLDISHESLWSPHPHLDIARLCKEEPFDLVIKTANKHGRFEGIFHTPLDWHLLRECPCPVLLVSEEKWPEGGSIITAIDANTDDKAHINLNCQLLETANYLGGLLNNNIIVANVCPPLPILVDLEFTSIDPSTSIISMHNTAKKNIKTIMAPYNIEESNIRVLNGIPEDEIPKLADRLDSRLIMLGTVSRSGLNGYIMGNTSEQLLHNLHCDVLALKPEGFQLQNHPQ